MTGDVLKVKHYKDVERQEAVTDGASGAGMRWVLGPEDEMPNFYLRVVEVEPGGRTMRHRHPYEHEVFVLEGEGELVDTVGKALALHPGHAAYVAPEELHQFRNAGEGTFRFICVIPRPK